MELEFFLHFRKILKYQISRANQSSWSRVVPYRRTDMTKLIVAVHNFAKTRLKIHIARNNTGFFRQTFFIVRLCYLCRW